MNLVHHRQLSPYALAFILSIAAYRPVAAFDYFSGVYAGVGTGFQQTQAQYNLMNGQIADLTAISGVAPAFNQNGTGSWGCNGGIFNIHAGYGLAMGVVYGGFEAGYSHILAGDSPGFTLETVTNIPLKISGSKQNGIYDVTSTLVLKPKSRMALAFRLGYLTTEKSMLFVTLGAAYSQYKLTQQNILKFGGTAGSGTGTAAASYTTTGSTQLTTVNCGAGSNCQGMALNPTTTSGSGLSLVLGIGAQVFLGKSVSFNMRYEYDMGKQISKLLNIQPNASSLRLGLSYNF